MDHRADIGREVTKLVIYAIDLREHAACLGLPAEGNERPIKSRTGNANADDRVLGDIAVAGHPNARTHLHVGKILFDLDLDLGAGHLGGRLRSSSTSKV